MLDCVCLLRLVWWEKTLPQNNLFLVDNESSFLRDGLVIFVLRGLVEREAKGGRGEEKGMTALLK